MVFVFVTLLFLLYSHDSWQVHEGSGLRAGLLSSCQLFQYLSELCFRGESSALW